MAGAIGSSPRVRGKRHEGRHLHARVRIIPASAGQTYSNRCGSVSITDHPRECGANVDGVHCGGCLLGSSPRVRGKHIQCGARIARIRIIPASAGQTIIADRRVTMDSDHPRECGANTGATYLGTYTDGSSPRVRGKPGTRSVTANPTRIIPASAGQTQ
ncbi:hypothetical protein BMIN_0698 [Bifidobacterium minimum]|uniref:Uncharacterized protein n=1 Tax=Bifidobacterium minimum TaxID=1693 RepID=A0A087BPN6_9BIFI|nr:hypothetical protein BMIN_0698 [Bifidobacterium minimum]